VGFELRTLVVIGTDCTGRCQSNYCTITKGFVSVYTHVLFKITSI
jgi:hypothetical protein